jgi:aminoglycoside phosphotransferase (APT) family kinase protein
LPDNSDDILDVLSHCKRQVNQLDALKSPTTIHRDFYHDQVLIDNDHVYLLDLDLLCNGDPALDIGNFIAHIEEQCLRQFDEPHYAQLQIERFIQRYQELAGCDLRSRIETYTTLSWARHIFISNRIPQRNPWTERIIQQCKQRIS